MSDYPSFSASDEELESFTRSSEHSPLCTDSCASKGNKEPSAKSSRRSSDDDHRPRQRRRLNAVPSMNDQNLQLACPFAKHDPVGHRRCFRYKMDQISRLKQHLFRVHQVPIHCVRCSQTFSTEDERDAHLRSIPGCTIQPHQTRLGINQAQKAQLTQRVSPKKSREENWYLVYEVLFPGSPRPESPYLDGTQFSEEVFALREFAMQQAPARITELTSSSHYNSTLPPALKSKVETFVFAAVKDVFDFAIDHWLRGTHPDQDDHTAANTPTPQPSLQSPASSSVTVEMNASTSSRQFIDPRHTEQGEDINGTFEWVLPPLTEGTRAWTGVDEPSGLDWLSMAANMDSRSWDEYLMTCLDGALQQPLK